MKYRSLLLVLLFVILAGMLISCEYFALPSENLNNPSDTKAPGVTTVRSDGQNTQGTDDDAKITSTDKSPIASGGPDVTSIPTTSQTGVHAHAFTQKVPTDKYLQTEADCKSPAIYRCSCVCGEAGGESFEHGTVADHQPDKTPVIYEPDCENPGREEIVCLACKEVISSSKTEALGHNEVKDEAVEPTETENGLTEGSHRSRCNKIFTAQIEIPAGRYYSPEFYENDAGYKYLASLEKGDALCALYERLDSASIAFHLGNDDASDDLEAFRVKYSDLGITHEQAFDVWAFYKSDRPLFYWMSNGASTTSSYLIVKVDEEYKSASVRRTYGEQIINTVKSYTDAVKGEDRGYMIALAYHDLIIKGADYAYDSNGNPESSAFAHSILGVSVLGKGVCESYAEFFSLLLNYSGVENMVITGESEGVNHAWNLVRLDDGKWYWCDLTWDDTPEWMCGISYNYFMVNDTDNVGYRDGGYKTENRSFNDNHTLGNGFGEFPPEYVPMRADKSYDPDFPILRDEIKYGGSVYMVMGFESLQLSSISNASGEVTVPSEISYDGRLYKVTYIGGTDADHLADRSSVVSAGVTAIYIPESVKFIWDLAFNCSTVTKIEVSKENKVFASYNGALYTKNYETLIQYPLGCKDSLWRVHDDTLYIAYGAMRSCFEQYPTYVKTIEVGSEFKEFGTPNYGYGYRDKNYDPESSPHYEYIEKELEYTKQSSRYTVTFVTK